MKSLIESITIRLYTILGKYICLGKADLLLRMEGKFYFLLVLSSVPLNK